MKSLPEVETGAFGIDNIMILASFPRTLQISISSRCHKSVRQTSLVPRETKVWNAAFSVRAFHRRKQGIVSIKVADSPHRFTMLCKCKIRRKGTRRTNYRFMYTRPPSTSRNLAVASSTANSTSIGGQTAPAISPSTVGRPTEDIHRI